MAEEAQHKESTSPPPEAAGDAAPPPAPGEPPPLPPTAEALAGRARDLQALRDALVDAAGVGAGLWFSYLFVLFYLPIAAGSVTHRDLFFESPVKLPFLNVDLPLLGSSCSAPPFSSSCIPMCCCISSCSQERAAPSGLAHGT